VTRGTTEGLALATRASLRDDFARLPLPPGGIVLVHSSLSAIGWVVGGPAAVVDALFDVLGTDGTIVVPTQTGHNRHPSRWNAPRIPEEQWDRVRDAIPAFDPERTPSYGMGRLAECVRTLPGARRSAHPQTSFAAFGPAAAELVAGHELESPLGEQSPLRRLAEAGAYTLLLGVGYTSCTAFHLAEYRQPDPPVHRNACAVRTARGREWVQYTTVALDDSDFARLGADFERQCPGVATGMVGRAPSRLFPVAAAAGYAQDWFAEFRVLRSVDAG
jgi:aminoglycoside 3-N-acetyltransferase